MSTLEVNKFVGAILVTLLMIWVIGIIGDALVHPGKVHGTAEIAIGEGKPVPSAPAKPAAAPAAPVAIGPLLAKASAEDGKSVARKCLSCHTFEDGGKTKVGPNLWNVVNASKASHEDFKYSDALRSKGGKWSYEELNAFLTNPRGFAKGTKMSFPGLKNPEDRAAVIKFLRTLSPSPAPLP